MCTASFDRDKSVRYSAKKGATMNLEDMIDLARRSRECAERAQQEAAFWQQMIDERMRTDDREIDYEAVPAFC
ncbi:hypothetical protein AWL63_11245 [Sphingomonas panacis]|uniref:Uncharacterized protein n=1 Tax=Sphingomonas panacis TaxID=1560345 RepID=A0A1B3ZAK5_9SPHN|nr:hypothetical protein AWL63_11245 [Sphingomonas panacis]